MQIRQILLSAGAAVIIAAAIAAPASANGNSGMRQGVKVGGGSVAINLAKYRNVIHVRSQPRPPIKWKPPVDQWPAWLLR
jgi:hypothetical protein